SAISIAATSSRWRSTSSRTVRCANDSRRFSFCAAAAVERTVHARAIIAGMPLTISEPLHEFEIARSLGVRLMRLLKLAYRYERPSSPQQRKPRRTASRRSRARLVLSHGDASRDRARPSRRRRVALGLGSDAGNRLHLGRG